MGDGWQRAWQALRGEFGDLNDVAPIVSVCVRLTVAAALGGLLGFERERKGKDAGLRTHMLVAIGSALFVLVPQLAGAAEADVTRIIQGLVAGIGFLGAGAIVKSKDGEEVRGLTTAAGIWLTAAVGMAAGLGRESTAILCTVLALAILSIGLRIEGWIPGSTNRDGAVGKPGGRRR